jgi:hypothetical protein
MSIGLWSSRPGTAAPAAVVWPRAQVPSAPVLGLRRDEALPERVVSGHDAVGNGDLPPLVDAELCAEGVAMRLRGTRGDTEALAQLVIREAGGEQFHDLPLALDVMPRRYFAPRGWTIDRRA